MHIPDGFIDGSTSAGAAAVAATGVGVSLKKASETLQEKQIPLCGLVAAFIFAVQMLNFPVAGGTSGHLLGGVLAAVLVGPWAAVLCVSVVLLVQGVVFADGGLTALGLNVINMALVTSLGGYAIYLGLRMLAPRTKSGVVVAAGIAAGCAVVLASIAFTVEYAIGGVGNASVGTVFGAMVGVHTVIGIGEGIITAFTVAAVLAVAARPRVRRTRSRAERRHSRRAGSELGSLAVAAARTRAGIAGLIVAGLLVALALAAFASPFASTEPDGLNKVAADHGLDRSARDSATAGSPLAGYSVKHVDNEKVTKGLAGTIGVVLTLLVAGAIFGGLWVVVRRRGAAPTVGTRRSLMGAGHHRPLTLDGESFLHRMAPECKVLATVLFVFVVVLTPREAFWAFAIYGAAIIALALAAQLPLVTLGRRLVLELPFLAFAFFLPFIGRGERVDVFGLSLSVDGLWGAWNILVKGTLGVAASSVLVATTDTRDILRGLERLHLPKVFVAIASFMLRYLEVIAGEMRAMRVARLSRGDDPRWIGQARGVAASAGTLFVRSYERGERVYLAMAAHGYDGTMPATTSNTNGTAAWGVAMLLPVGAAFVAATAWILS